MKSTSKDSRNTYSKAGLVMLGIACLLFLTGLIKDPAPSDTIRSVLVSILAAGGIVSYLVGMVVAAKRSRSGKST